MRKHFILPRVPSLTLPFTFLFVLKTKQQQTACTEVSVATQPSAHGKGLWLFRGGVSEPVGTATSDALGAEGGPRISTVLGPFLFFPLASESQLAYYRRDFRISESDYHKARLSSPLNDGEMSELNNIDLS